MQTGSNSIQDQLSRMQGEVLGVVGGEWQGAASGQFHALWDEWQRSAAGLKDALDGISPPAQQRRHPVPVDRGRDPLLDGLTRYPPDPIQE